MRRIINNTFSAMLALLVLASCSDINNSGVDGNKLRTVEGSTAKSSYKDMDNNGYPDEGEVVTGTYSALYAYDANGDFYFDLGDGRVQGTVGSVSELDQSTLTTCQYQVQYRGGYENDPFLDNGWVKNNIKCNGYDYDNAQSFNYTIVHETDPRYTGEKQPAFGGTWEYYVYAIGGEGNTVRPETPVGN